MRTTTALAVGTALLTISTGAHAQSAYDYPWCGVRNDRSGAQSCYFATYAQCMQTMSGIGGYCIRSPYYRGGRRHLSAWCTSSAAALSADVVEREPGDRVAGFIARASPHSRRHSC